MGSELVGIISALAGGLLTGLISIKITNNQLRHEREKLLIENEIAIKNERASKLSAFKEELFGLVENISFECSQTKNYIMEETGITLNDFHAHYQKVNQMAMRAKLIAYLHFPNLIKEINEIYGLTNVMWGNQQNYFGYSTENEQKQGLLRDIVKYSMDLSTKCSVVMNLLSSS